MRNIIFIIIIVAFCGCNSASRRGSSATFPVIALLSRVDCTWFEDSMLNKRAGIEKPEDVYLNFVLTNPNDSPVYLPMHRDITDTLYKSHIEVYHKGHKLNTEKQHSHPIILKGKEQCTITVKIQNIGDTELCSDFSDIKKAFASLEFKYVKDESDSIYGKKRVGDMKFYIDDVLEFTYREPETFGRFVMWR